MPNRIPNFVPPVQLYLGTNRSEDNFPLVRQWHLLRNDSNGEGGACGVSADRSWERLPFPLNEYPSHVSVHPPGVECPLEHVLTTLSCFQWLCQECLDALKDTESA